MATDKRQDDDSNTAGEVQPAPTADSQFDMIIIGAGFSGMYALIKAREMGLTVQVLEKGGDVGGTWYWNRYPGARCDVESVEYCYSFSSELEQEWDWPERYSAQPDILAYQQHVADRFQLRPSIRFNCRMSAARFDESSGMWDILTDDGSSYRCRYLVAATGPLSTPLKPGFEGMDEFQGETYHTGEWPHENVDFSGKRVAVIGTGSSGIQSIPLIAAEADALDVYQRTPAYAIPARNRVLSDQERDAIKANYAARRQEASSRMFPLGASYPQGEETMAEQTPEQVEANLEKWWQVGGLQYMLSYPELVADEETNRVAADYFRSRVAEMISDPEYREKLMPQGVLGAKRLCVDTDYYETFNRDNVTLIDVNETPIERLTANGIQTSDGERHYDAIVFATGYDGMTGTLSKLDIRGRDNLQLGDAWRESPRTYLGMQVSGFPNLFIPASGVGTSAVFTNMVVSIEHQVNWIFDCLTYARQSGKTTIEADPEAEQGWVEQVQETAEMTLFLNANSWYLGANVPGKRRVFMPYIGGYPAYVDICSEEAEKGYPGFNMS
jgi:cyclohexanone monooxygenase